MDDPTLGSQTHTTQSSNENSVIRFIAQRTKRGFLFGGSFAYSPVNVAVP